MAINPYDPYQKEIIGIEQQKALAQKLREAAMESPQGQMVSGWYVAPHWTSQLARGLKFLAGEKQGKEADTKLENMFKEAQAKNEAWQMAMPKPIVAGQEIRYEGPGARTREQEAADDAKIFEATGVQPKAEIAQQSYTPSPEDLAQWAMTNPASTPADRAALAMTIAKLRTDKEAQKEIAKERIQSQEMIAREGMQSRREIAQMMAGQRMVNVLGPNGESIMMPASEVGPGMERWTPQGAKAKQTEQKTGVAKNEVSDIVGTLSGSYNRLKELNAIPSTQNAAGTNLAAKLSSSGLGQVFGGALGTEAQSERDKIAQTRPLLLNAIKNATGMSAQQMNSNAELQLYLKAATDPTISFEANMKALENLDRLYGLGLTKGQPGARPMGSPTGISAPPPGAVRRIQ